MIPAAPLRAALLGLLFGLWAALAAQAQLSEVQSEVYNDWLADVEVTEAEIDNPNTSTAVLEARRATIVNWREQFTALRQDNQDRIRTLESQIAALGPAPENGDEAAEVTDLRNRLVAEYDELRLPVILAEQGRNRASGLIQEIDNLLSDRVRSRMLRRDPSPFSLSNIAHAADDLARTSFIIDETRALLSAPTVREELRRHGPALLVLVMIAGYLLVNGARLGSRIGARLTDLFPKGELAWFILIRLLRVALPFAGLVLMVQGLIGSGIFGLRTLLVLETVPRWGAILIGYAWLSYHLFARTDGGAYFRVSPAKATQMQALAAISALCFIALDFVGLYETVEVVAQSTLSVLRYPLIVMQALALFRIQQIAFTAERNDGEVSGELVDTLPFVRRLMVVVLATCVLAGALGYVELAGSVVFSIAFSLMLVGLVLILQRGAADFWAYVLRRSEGGRDQLLTAVTSIVLWVGSLPGFAVIWGARPDQLLELWSQFLDGVQFGETRLSPAVFVSLALIFGLGVLMTRLLQSTLTNRLLPKTRIDPGGQAAIVSGVGYVGIGSAALIAVTGAGLDLSSLAIVAGALSVGIGFGLQTIVSNFVSGIILLIERPVSKGDWISVAGNMGYVRDISVRSTRIETFDRTDVIVPNSDLISGTVVNYTRGNTVGRVIVPVGVAYGTDTRRVETILRDIANAHPMVLANPAPTVVFQGFGADSLDFEIRAILRDVNWVLTVKSDMNHDIARRFSEEGIEIPFAQRDVWLRNPEALTRPAPNPVGPPAPASAEDSDRAAHLDVLDLEADTDGAAPDADGDAPR